MTMMVLFNLIIIQIALENKTISEPKQKLNLENIKS